MDGEKVIGKHRKCGGEVESWYQDGHYFYYSGIFCRKCKKKFDSIDDKGINLFEPKPPETDMSYVDLAKR